MKLLRKLFAREWLVWLAAIVFGGPLIVATVVFILSINGCASVFEAPELEQIPIPNPDRVAKCFVVIEGVRWQMARGQGECLGWQPL